MAKRIKTRYKICFQTQNKVWIYKNSRLRNFYKIRNRIVLKQGRIARRFLITKNMKWTVIRRRMVPYTRVKNQFRFNFKNLFFMKQQLKNFYGGIQEYKLRNIFKKNWNVAMSFKRNVFIGALEQRINMILFRMRLLPTIFSCTQMIMHTGIFANEKLITLPSYRVKIGEIISIPQDQWLMFYKFLYKRLYSRCFADAMLYWRKYFILQKIQKQRMRDKKAYIKSLEFIDEFGEHFQNFKKYKKKILKIYCYYKKNLYKSKSIKNKKLNKKTIKFLKIYLFFYIYLEKYLQPIILNIKKKVELLRTWNPKTYNQYTHKLFKHMVFIYHILNKISNFITFSLLKIISQKALSKKNIKLKFLKKFWENILSKTKENNLKKELYLTLQWNFSYKKTVSLKLKSNTYKKHFFYRLRKIKNLKKKKNLFKNWCWQIHWYTPHYLEIDYCTLRCVFVYYPEMHEVFYGFPCSFNKIISFYKERSL